MAEKPYYLRASMHGGKCCGVKHIYSFTFSPSSLLPSQEACPGSDSDKYGDHVNTDTVFVCSEAPEETADKRLIRVVNDIIKKRPSGVIEITLTSYQLAHWRETIAEIGFKEVTKFTNSNSGNTVHIFHLISYGGKILKDTEEKKEK